MHVFFEGARYTFRSTGVLRFLDCLHAAAPAWVDVTRLLARFPGGGPRQFARYIDYLDKAGLAWVDYQNKTTGPFRLRVAAAALRIDLRTSPSDSREPVRIAAALPESATAPAPDLMPFFDPRWLDWTLALLEVLQTMPTGSLDMAEASEPALAAAARAAAGLPAWAMRVVWVRRAHALARASRYREAGYALRRIEAAARAGTAHPLALDRARMLKAKIRYDQGRYAASQALLEAVSAAPLAEMDVQSLNMRALLNGARFLKTGDAQALHTALATLLQAMGLVFLGYGDSTLLNALTYNYSNNLLRAVRGGLAHRAQLGATLSWLAGAQTVCHKLGVGDDSVLADVLLAEVGLEFDFPPACWPPDLRRTRAVPDSLPALIEHVLNMARAVGNRLEIGHCLELRMRACADAVTARPFYQEGRALFRELERRDLLAALEATWVKGFGSAGA